MKPLKLTMSAFGPYAEKTEVDFEKYKNGLYIITGDTGAGKSTIFDAITYALYGEASTVRRENSMLRSDFASKDVKTFVELEFLYRDEVYKIYRNPKYSREGYKTDESAKAEMIYPDGSIKTGVKEVTNAVIELLGIDCGQFTQISMIAQGEFLKLLLAGTDERGRIFRKIFNTDIYRRFQDLLKTNCAEKRREYEDVKAEINREIENVISDEDFSLYDWSRCEEFANELDRLIKSDEKLSKDGKKQEKEIKKKIEEQSAKITSATKNNEILSLLSDEYEKRETLEKMLFEIAEEKEKLKRIEEIATVVPVFERVQSKRDSVKRLFDVIDSHKKKIENCNAVINDLKDTFKKEAEKEPIRKALSDKITRLKNEFSRYEEIEKLEDGRENALRSLDVAEKTVFELKKEIESEKTGVKELEEMLSAMKNAEAEYEKSKQYLNEQKKINEKLQKLHFENNELKKTKERYNNLTEEYINSERESTKINAEYTEQYNLFLREQAGIIAQELKDNEPCPVCGSKDHPCVAVKSDKAPTKSELDILKEKTDLSLAQSRELSEKAGNAKQEYEVLEKSIMTVLTEMYSGTVSDIDHVLSEIAGENERKLCETKEAVSVVEKTLLQKENAEKELKNKTGHIIENEKSLESAETELNGCIAELKGFDSGIKAMKAMVSYKNKAEAEERLSSFEEEYSTLLKQYQDAETAYKECLSDIDKSEAFIADNSEIAEKESDELDNDEEKLKSVMVQFGIGDESGISLPDEKIVLEMKLKTEKYDDDVKKCHERIKVLEETATGKELVDITKLEAERDALNQELETMSENSGEVNARISVNKKVKARVTLLAEKMEECERKYALMLNLSQTANGELAQKHKIAFEQYIQSAYFKSMLNEANKRFMYMTNGRFELVKRDANDNLKSKGGLEIDVFDNYTGKCRDVKTLSGGESFKASLCMALGMSEVIQRNSGGVKLESMFVDEGFGVLDEESLSQAVEILIELSESDRMVGIISHITELKDRIDKKIIVKRDTSGSRIELNY